VGFDEDFDQSVSACDSRRVKVDTPRDTNPNPSPRCIRPVDLQNPAPYIFPHFQHFQTSLHETATSRKTTSDTFPTLNRKAQPVGGGLFFFFITLTPRVE